jgi:cytochrome c oxidase assembly protein subunit 15
MGIHGFIEFGNRLFSILVGFIAVAMVLLLIRMWQGRRELFLLSLFILAGTVLQGLIGGISVRVQLDPSIVGVHFAISVALVVIAAVLVYRVHYGPRGERARLPRWIVILAHVTSVLVAITIVVGILTTGSGPHAGDSVSARNGLDSVLLQHVHSWPAYATSIATLALVVGAFRSTNVLLRRFSAALLVIELVQVAVGLAQSRLGLPPLLVGIHMVLACCLAAAMAAVVLSLRYPVNSHEMESQPPRRVSRA